MRIVQYSLILTVREVLGLIPGTEKNIFFNVNYTVHKIGYFKYVFQKKCLLLQRIN